MRINKSILTTMDACADGIAFFERMYGVDGEASHSDACNTIRTSSDLSDAEKTSMEDWCKSLTSDSAAIKLISHTKLPSYKTGFIDEEEVFSTLTAAIEARDNAVEDDVALRLVGYFRFSSVEIIEDGMAVSGLPDYQAAREFLLMPDNIANGLIVMVSLGDGTRTNAASITELDNIITAQKDKLKEECRSVRGIYQAIEDNEDGFIAWELI